MAFLSTCDSCLNILKNENRFTGIVWHYCQYLTDWQNNFIIGTKNINRNLSKNTNNYYKYYLSLTLTWINGNALPGLNGVFSCSIMYSRYGESPCSSYTFLSLVMSNRALDEIAIMIAVSGLGCKHTYNVISMTKNTLVRMCIVQWFY